MRRLPVYLLVDVSESMVGEPLAEVGRGIGSLVQELRCDPYALETVFLGLIAFAGKAEMLGQLTEIAEFRAPALPLGSGTDLGSGLDLLMRSIDGDVQKTTETQKGDWKPIVFLFTDGAPTVDASESVARWQKGYRDRCNFVSITFGRNADVPLLEKLGSQVLTLTDTSAASFREFFKWVSASLQASSVGVAENDPDGFRLADTRINLEKAKASPVLDENFILLSMKCANSGKFWLAKYDSRARPPFPLLGAYPVDEESYRRMSSAGSAATVDTAQLEEMPVCPECGDRSLVHCHKCGQLSCAGTNAEHVCPWCGTRAKLVFSDGFAVGRNAG